jgi:hypothetical protein
MIVLPHQFRGSKPVPGCAWGAGPPRAGFFLLSFHVISCHLRPFLQIHFVISCYFLGAWLLFFVGRARRRGPGAKSACRRNMSPNAGGRHFGRRLSLPPLGATAPKHLLDTLV